MKSHWNQIVPDFCSRRTFLAGLGICLAGTHVSAGPAPAPLRAGVAKSKVTPPLEIPYLDSPSAASNARFQGVHDDLFARALVLDDGRRPIALLAVDSIGYDNDVLGPGRDFTGELRERIAAKTGLKPEAVMLAATHTHSAPETLDLTPFREAAGVSQWLDRHLEQLADTVILAWERRTPVRIRSGSVAAPNLQRYRRIALKAGGESRSGPLPPEADVATPWRLDETLQVLHLETMDGRPHSVVLNYTAHPIVAPMKPPEVLISADFPGATTAFIEEKLPGAVCLFTNGCAGNVNSIKVVTSFSDVDAVGRRLGELALECVERLKSGPAMTETRLAYLSETCELPSRSTKPLAEARQAAEMKPSEENKRLLRLAQKLARGPIRAEVQALSVGPVHWIALPGEAFVETGLALKEAGATFVVGYANGYLGYLPIRRSYEEGGYEVILGNWSRVAPGSAERLQSFAQELLGRIVENPTK